MQLFWLDLNEIFSVWIYDINKATHVPQHWVPCRHVPNITACPLLTRSHVVWCLWCSPSCGSSGTVSVHVCPGLVVRVEVRGPVDRHLLPGLPLLQPAHHLAPPRLPHAPVVWRLREADVVVGDLGEVGARPLGGGAGRVDGGGLYTLLQHREVYHRSGTAVSALCVQAAWVQIYFTFCNFPPLQSNKAKPSISWKWNKYLSTRSFSSFQELFPLEDSKCSTSDIYIEIN